MTKLPMSRLWGGTPGPGDRPANRARPTGDSGRAHTDSATTDTPTADTPTTDTPTTDTTTPSPWRGRLSADHVYVPARLNPSPWRGRLVVLAGLAIAALNARIMVAVVAPIIGLITTDIPLTSTDEGIIGLTAPLVFAVAGACSPALGRRYGLEAMMVAALAASALGEVGRAMATTPMGFIAWTIPALAGAGIGNVITPPLIKKYFPDRLSAVTAFYTFLTTISVALPPLFIYRIATTMGWRFSVGVWAVIAVVAITPWLAVLFSSARAGSRWAAVKRRLDPRTRLENQPRMAVPLWRNKVAWAITATFAGNSMLSYTMFAWLPHVLRDAGISAETAALYLAVFTAGSLPGALLTPLLVTRVKRTWILPVVFFLAYAVSFTALAIRPGYLTLLWMLLSRLGDCFFPYAYCMINLRTRTPRGSIAMSGFAQPVSYAIAILGPWGFGALHTLTGNWHVPMFAVVAVLPFMLVGGIIAARSAPVEI